MADFDAQLPVRAIATQFTTEVADSAGTTINPAKEDGNLLSIKNDADTLAGGVVGGKYQENLAQVGGSAISLGQALMAASVPVVIASNQSNLPINITQVGGSAITLGQKTMANSLPVVVASDQSPIPVTVGDVLDESPQYNTAASLAANASSTQTYSPGSTVNLDGVDASASGQMKIEIQWGTTGSETTKAVFFTSKGNLQLQWRLPYSVTITNTMSVKVIRTNTDNQAMDVYSTIQVH